MIIVYKTFVFEITSTSLNNEKLHHIGIVETPLRIKFIDSVFTSMDEVLEKIKTLIDSHLDNFGGVAHQFRNKAHDKIEIYPHRTAKGGDKT